MKLTKAQAGKLGGINSGSARLKLARIEKYNLSPKTCLQCSKNLSYDEKHKKFCNTSCSAIYNNLKREKKVKVKYGDCLGCKGPIFKVNMIFCNQKCRTKHYKDKRIDAGLYYKKDVIELQGYKCNECGITDWQDKPLVLELEHKDGNSDNNAIENLCLLCPNCHSQTDTYKSKNRGNGRHLRRQRYAEKKSF